MKLKLGLILLFLGLSIILISITAKDDRVKIDSQTPGITADHSLSDEVGSSLSRVLAARQEQIINPYSYLSDLSYQHTGNLDRAQSNVLHTYAQYFELNNEDIAAFISAAPEAEIGPSGKLFIIGELENTPNSKNTEYSIGFGVADDANGAVINSQSIEPLASSPHRLAAFATPMQNWQQAIIINYIDSSVLDDEAFIFFSPDNRFFAGLLPAANFADSGEQLTIQVFASKNNGKEKGVSYTMGTLKSEGFANTGVFSDGFGFGDTDTWQNSAFD